MTQFYETSAFKNGKLSAERMASYQCVLRFPFRLSKVLRLPRKSEARSREVLHLSRKMIFPKLKICSKTQPLSGNHRPGLLTCLGDVSCTALSTRNLSLQVLFKRPSPAVVFETAAKPTRLAHPWQGAESIAPATNNDASTSKSAANPKCFEHLDFQMCFTPQDTRASTFSRAPAPKVLQCWGVFAILTSKFASHHNHVQFLISHPAKWLRTRRCSEPTFRPSGGIKHWGKNTVVCNFSTFSRCLIFFLLTLSSLTLLATVAASVRKSTMCSPVILGHCWLQLQLLVPSKAESQTQNRTSGSSRRTYQSGQTECSMLQQLAGNPKASKHPQHLIWMEAAFFPCFFPSRFGSCTSPYCSNDARCSCACQAFLGVAGCQQHGAWLRPTKNHQPNLNMQFLHASFKEFQRSHFRFWKQ